MLLKKAHSTTGKNILDYAVDNRLPHYVALLAPYTFIRNFISIMFSSFPGLISPAIKIADIFSAIITNRLEVNKSIDKNLIKGTVPITNNDLFMAYTEYYLKNHPGINKEMIITCRQAAPTPEGLPVEIYAFTTDVTLVGHHEIASEIINHLIGMVNFFDLKLFEMLSDTAENP